MTKEEDFKLLKIQTIVLKVSIHCDGCKQKVRKLLQRIEGVYTVNINEENQKVTVSGNVNSATLIKRLARSGKHAELFSQKPNQNQKQNNPNPKNNNINQKQQQKASAPIKEGIKNNKEQGNQGLMQGLKDFKNQHTALQTLSSDDDTFDDDGDDYDDDDDEDDDVADLLFMEKMKQANLMKQGNNTAAAAAAAAGGGKKNGNGGGNGSNGGGGKKKGGGNPNQPSPNAPQPKGSSINAQVNPKMGNPPPHHSLNVNPGDADAKRMAMMNSNGMMGMGLHGLGTNNMQGRNNISGFGLNQHQQPPMMGGMHGPQTTAPMMMNMRGPCNNNGMMMMGPENRYMMMQQQQQQQPQAQMMYNRSTQLPPYTGYYYQSHPSPYYLQSQRESSDYGVHLFNDENTNSCSIM